MLLAVSSGPLGWSVRPLPSVQFGTNGCVVCVGANRVDPENSDHLSRVLSADTEVRTDQHIHNPNHITLTGAGGTDMATGITTAAENNPDAIIVITDGYTPWPPTPPPGARTVIAALTDHHRIHRIPGWIQSISIVDPPPN